MAVALAEAGTQTAYVDCDVEEPNGHIFLKPEITRTVSIGIPCPVVDESKCTDCGKCGEICQYSAIISLKTKPLTFPNLCHGCGGCTLICPEKAIREEPREIGVLEEGNRNSLRFIQGRLNIGEAMSPPLIKAVRKAADDNEISIIDAPPGTSCPVIAAVKDCDFGLLVTEPTPFGLNDLKLAVGMYRELELPFGVVINRCDIGDERVWKYCGKKNIPVMQEIPDDRKVAEIYSRGDLVIQHIFDYRKKITQLMERIQKRAAWLLQP